MTKTFLVTGGTGMVGRHVVTALRRAGAKVRILTRNGKPATEGIEYLAGDTTDAASIADAVRGVDGAFLLWPSFDTTSVSSVAKALADRCNQVVYLSANGVPDDPSQPSPLFHAAVERALKATGVATTMLRPTGFASNVSVWADQIRGGDVVRWPFAQARRSLIHERDIGEVAAQSLLREAHRNQTYMLTGPQSLTQAMQVALIGAAIGRSLRFEEQSQDEARVQLAQAWGSLDFVDAALSGWAAMVDAPEPVNDRVSSVLGRPALSFAQWCLDHRQDFGGMQDGQ